MGGAYVLKTGAIFDQAKVHNLKFSHLANEHIRYATDL